MGNVNQKPAQPVRCAKTTKSVDTETVIVLGIMKNTVNMVVKMENATKNQ